MPTRTTRNSLPARAPTLASKTPAATHIAELQPATFLENWYVDQIVSNEWRRQRVESAQKWWLEQQAHEGVHMSEIIFTKQLATLHRYESSYRRASESAFRKLKALQKERRAAEAMEAQATEQPTPAPASPRKLQNEPNSAERQPASADPKPTTRSASGPADQSGEAPALQ